MIKINMGCGKRDFGDNWIHIDGSNHKHVKYNDITKLEFIDESVDLIYASHVIEYFDRKQIVTVLKEWNRVLKKNAILRLAVPDFNTITKLYLDKKFELDSFLGPLYGKMLMDENYIYHKTVYDFESLNKILTSSGFIDVNLYDWRTTEHSHFDDHSQAYLPHMDKENGTLISLNVECKKG